MSMKEAISEYHRKQTSRIALVERDDGLFSPPEDDRCPLCLNAAWSCRTGAHLKTEEHIALKFGIEPKDLIAVLHNMKFTASDFGWKSVRYVENSYLRSANDYIWLPNQVNYAKCDQGCQESEIPGDECSCGFYFHWSPFQAHENGYGEVLIKCKIGGNVIEASEGCRAQAAVIVGIYHNNHEAREKELAELYNVPLIDMLEGEYFDD
jgi:hypothetical protein